MVGLRGKLTPLGQGCEAVLLEGFAAIQMTFSVEVVVDRGMDDSPTSGPLCVRERPKTGAVPGTVPLKRRTVCVTGRLMAEIP